MELKGKALYNLLRINWLENSSMPVSPWQVEDYRLLSLSSIFSRLQQLGISLNEENFLMYATSVSSPEELVECLCVNDDNLEVKDQSYLLLFELWRRLIVGKACLSIFCDELDYLIELYDKAALQESELLKMALLDLEDILDTAADAQGSPQEVFDQVIGHCAHDLQTFIYDYIVSQIEDHEDVYASELLDAFYEFVTEKVKFDFLRARLFIQSNPKGGSVLILRLLEQLSEQPDFEFLLEVMEYLVTCGDESLFKLAAIQGMALLNKEEHLQIVGRLVADYYRCLDREEEELLIENLMKQRSSRLPEQSLDPADPVLFQLLDLLKP